MLEKVLLAAAAISTSGAPARTLADPEPCHLAKGVALGCIGEEASDNAADLFEEFGFDKARILQDHTRDYIGQYDCLRIVESPRFKLKYNGLINKRRVVTASGYVEAYYLQIDGGDRKPVLWIAAPYFSGYCLYREPPDSTMTAPQAR